MEYLFGSVVDWDTLAFINAFLPVVALFLAFLIPESPSWLISSKKDEDRCRASLKRVRDSRCDVDIEVNDLIMFSKSNGSTSFKEKWRLTCQPSTYKPFVIVSLYFLLSQFSGLNVVTFYAVDVIRVSAGFFHDTRPQSPVLTLFYFFSTPRTRVPPSTSTWPPSCWASSG